MFYFFDLRIFLSGTPLASGDDQPPAMREPPPHEMPLTPGQGAEVRLRCLDFTIDGTETVDLRAMREIDVAVAMQAHLDSFHSCANSSKQDAFDPPRTVLSLQIQ